MKNIKLYETFIEGSPDAIPVNFGEMFIKFLWVRDQAHIFHWQTKLNSHHTILGDFYEDYLEELDELAEVIFGKTGGTFSVGSGTMKLVDYSEDNLLTYLKEVSTIFEKDLPDLFPRTSENEGIYHVLGDILEIVQKTKYLLSQE